MRSADTGRANFTFQETQWSVFMVTTDADNDDFIYRCGSYEHGCTDCHHIHTYGSLANAKMYRK